jgi:LuxR family maltose regulon positive regulatory protein
LFLSALDGEHRWFRYHPLFAEMLRARLQQAWPNIVPELHHLRHPPYHNHSE